MWLAACIQVYGGEYDALVRMGIFGNRDYRRHSGIWDVGCGIRGYRKNLFCHFPGIVPGQFIGRTQTGTLNRRLSLTERPSLGSQPCSDL